MEWNFADKRDLKVVAYLLATSLAKQVDLFAAMWALKVAHVLDYSYYRNIELVEHANRFNCHVHGNVLRRSDNENAGDRYRLRNRKWRVASSRRQVDYEIIKLAPV